LNFRIEGLIVAVSKLIWYLILSGEPYIVDKILRQELLAKKIFYLNSNRR
jgi:hypothetical protein